MIGKFVIYRIPKKDMDNISNYQYLTRLGWRYGQLAAIPFGTKAEAQTRLNLMNPTEAYPDHHVDVKGV